MTLKGQTLLTDDRLRSYATDHVLQRYHLADLDEAQRRLTPSQFESLLREIDAVQAQIAAQLTAEAAPRRTAAGADGRGLTTPIGPILPATGLLLVLIWAVFALEDLQPGGSGSTAVLYNFGGVTSDTLASGQYWRLLATCFLHVGAFHIISNSIALIWLGSLAERLYGSLRYLGIYLAAGIGGSVVAVLTSPPAQVSARASGAIMGLLGAMLAGAWRNRRVLDRSANRQLFTGLLVVLVFNLAYGFATPDISNAAHLGGAATGAALALLIPYRSPNEPRTFARAANLLSILLIVATLALSATYLTAH